MDVEQRHHVEAHVLARAAQRVRHVLNAVREVAVRERDDLRLLGRAARVQHERQEGATMTGGDLVSGSPLSKTIADLEARVQADGQDIDALNQLSFIAINAGDLGAAMGWLDKARAVAPEHPEVRTHMAILQASVGMGSRAKKELDAVLEEVPTLSKALLWKGLIALQSGEREGAVSALESALEHALGFPGVA